MTVEGQVTIPQHIRELAGIRRHSDVQFYFEDGKVWLSRPRPTRDREAWIGISNAPFSDKEDYG